MRSFQKAAFPWCRATRPVTAGWTGGWLGDINPLNPTKICLLPFLNIPFSPQALPYLHLFVADEMEVSGQVSLCQSPASCKCLVPSSRHLKPEMAFKLPERRTNTEKPLDDCISWSSSSFVFISFPRMSNSREFSSHVPEKIGLSFVSLRLAVDDTPEFKWHELSQC